MNKLVNELRRPSLMRQKFHLARNSSGAFILVDLLFVAVVLSLLVALHLPSYSRLRERTHLTIDQNNLHHILRASAIYNNDSNDYMAHPTWGAELTGPDGWAYITRNLGRIPGAPNNAPSCSAYDINSLQFTNQVKFFQHGQVTQHLPGIKTTWCPKDVATRGSGTLQRNWLFRAQKVTSYLWNGTVGGYAGIVGNPPPNNLTYKVSDFLPSDWLMWEANDNLSFSFNDAAENPEAIREGISFRHSGLPKWWGGFRLLQRDLPGVAVIGTFGGDANLVRLSHVYDVSLEIQHPNHLYNGPRYQR